jgi:hypothetical protein
MNAGQVKHKAGEWVTANRSHWLGLRAAHLVGGITTMPDGAPFPAYKDVDIHLIFDAGSPMLESHGPFINILEVPYDGLILEAGLKPVTDYRSAEAVLANPEIAHHLTVDSVLYDPDGMLAGLRPVVTREYARRKWVLARIEYERNGLRGVLDNVLPMARASYGIAGELNILGYTLTYLSALFSVATLRSPTTGSRALLRIRDVVAEVGRSDLYEETLSILGLQHVDPAGVTQRLQEAGDAFDLAVQVRRTPTPFQHKLNPHQRGYFIDACRSLIDEGYYREAMGWLMPFGLSCVAVILADGPEAEKPKYAALLDRLLRDLGFDTPAAVDVAVERMRRLCDQCLALAGYIVATYPAIID